MDEKQPQSHKLAKNLKMPEDLSQLYSLLKEISVEAAPNAEMVHRIGHDKYPPKSRGNPRNGYSFCALILPVNTLAGAFSRSSRAIQR